MIGHVEDYFSKGCGRCARFATSACSARKWNTGLGALRGICHEVGLAETVKWGHPCYMHGDRNIAILGAFQTDFRISFFDAAVLRDAEGLLERPGPNTQHPNMIRFLENAAVARLRPVLLSYLREVMEHARRGIKPKRVTAAFDLPVELSDALAADSELAQAFHTLSSGRQRSYAIALNGVKTAATRTSRIAKFRAAILNGKGANERP